MSLKPSPGLFLCGASSHLQMERNVYVSSMTDLCLIQQSTNVEHSEQLVNKQMFDSCTYMAIGHATF